jgi:Flp pilus assembly protein TadG
VDPISTDERGGATSVEMALLWVGMLALVLAVVQVSLVFYGGQLALTAAEDGLRSGRTYPVSSTAAAQNGAESFLRRAAGTTFSARSVQAEVLDGGTTMRVTVAGEALSLVPGVPIRITRSAAGAIEQVRP